jgi:hypothetical protein
MIQLGLVRDQYRETLGPYRTAPKEEVCGCTDRVVGAVSIGSFELSRWRLRRTRWAIGFQSLRAGCRVFLQATETKRDMVLFLNIALKS